MRREAPIAHSLSRRMMVWSLLGICGVLAAVGLFTLLVNILMVENTRAFVVSSPSAAPSAAVVIVPAAAMMDGDIPTPEMRDRMDVAILLYREGKVKALDLSGYPDEVIFMAGYAIQAGVPASDLLRDPAGFDTYDTMANASKLLHLDKALICTQRYHLSRSVYLARSMGIEAVGVPADVHSYPGTLFDSTGREWGARVKAFLQVTF